MIFDNKYEVKDFIGNGGFGIVYKVLDIKDKAKENFFALKFINNIDNIEINIFKKKNEKIIKEIKK